MLLGLACTRGMNGSTSVVHCRGSSPALMRCAPPRLPACPFPSRLQGADRAVRAGLRGGRPHRATQTGERAKRAGGAASEAEAVRSQSEVHPRCLCDWEEPA